MGIDVNALHLLLWASRKPKGLGSVVTLGRQHVSIANSDLKKEIALPTSYSYPTYCEELLTAALGAKSVESFDNSSFEGCTFVADFNKPLGLPHSQYSTVVDFGCSEHVYNVAQAFSNLSALCEDGGQILHYLPSNNCCGHGFWQFSPEVFFSLYSNENGYAETQVFMVDLDQSREWYEVVPPRNGQRNAIWSDRPLYVLCRTVRRGKCTHEKVQQSDYVFLWDKQVDPLSPLASAATIPFMRAGVRRYAVVRFVHRKLMVLLGLKKNGLLRNSSLIRRRIDRLR